MLDQQRDRKIASQSNSPVLFLRVLSLEYMLVYGDEDEEERRMSEEASAAWDDDDDDEDDEDCVIKESIFWECKEQSLQK